LKTLDNSVPVLAIGVPTDGTQPGISSEVNTVLAGLAAARSLDPGGVVGLWSLVGGATVEVSDLWSSLSSALSKNEPSFIGESIDAMDTCTLATQLQGFSNTVPRLLEISAPGAAVSTVCPGDMLSKAKDPRVELWRAITHSG